MERIEDLVYIFLCMNNVVPVNGLNILYQVMVIKFWIVSLIYFLFVGKTWLLANRANETEWNHKSLELILYWYCRENLDIDKLAGAERVKAID